MDHLLTQSDQTENDVACTASKLSSLRACFAGRLHTRPEDQAPFLTDWRGKWRGQALAVAQPDTTADVAAVVAV